MDANFLNLTPEAQLDLMNMMIHMEKLSELTEQPTTPPPPPSSANFTSGPSPAFYSTTTIPKSTVFVGPASSISFNGTTSQERAIISPNHSNPTTPTATCTSTELSFAVDPCQVSSRASVAAMREMIFRIAAMQPIHIDPESVKAPKRRNVKISKDPQSVAARHRRERISERIRILQRLVPGGTKMDTASMLDEAIHYVKFLKTQVQSLERAAGTRSGGLNSGGGLSNGNYSCLGRMYELQDQGIMNHNHMLS